MTEGAEIAPSNVQPSPEDNHDTMCVGWQGTSLAVNSNVTDGNEFSEVGARRATKPLPPYSTGLRDTPLQKCNFGGAPFTY